MFALFDELQMLRVILIFVLHPFRLKLEIQGDLVSLIDHRAMASCHFARVKAHHAWNGRKVFFGVREDFIRCVRLGGICPKDDNMRKHLLIYEGFSRGVQSVNSRRCGQPRLKVVVREVAGVQELQELQNEKSESFPRALSFSEIAVFSEKSADRCREEPKRARAKILEDRPGSFERSS
jgi:hypothetical protein